MDVVGADVWRKGWVAVLLGESGVGAVVTCDRIGELAAAFPDAASIGVDIPIGLPDRPPRRADDLARRFVGPRASSVFPAPPRVVLEASDYAEARRLSNDRFGRGVSAQSFALRDRILEVDVIVRADRRLHEVHPEVSFRHLAGAPLSHPKKTWNGQMERRNLLAAAGVEIPDLLAGHAGAVPPDDVLDAAVVAWSARRIARGEAQRFPCDDVAGAGVIWY